MAYAFSWVHIGSNTEKMETPKVSLLKKCISRKIRRKSTNSTLDFSKNFENLKWIGESKVLRGFYVQVRSSNLVIR